MKIGLLGHIGRFSSADGREFSRNDEVICRTQRGLEVGSIMCALTQYDSVMENTWNTSTESEPDGPILRRLTPDDRMILNRIDRFRDRAFLACQRLIQQKGLRAVLVDVEHLFDGQSLYFYFLGNVPDPVHELTDELADEYEKKVRFKKFTEKLASGCGPDCGTGESKCSTGGCSSCSVSSACKSKV